jgi:hypothetical protein
VTEKCDDVVMELAEGYGAEEVGSYITQHEPETASREQAIVRYEVYGRPIFSVEYMSFIGTHSLVNVMSN